MPHSSMLQRHDLPKVAQLVHSQLTIEPRRSDFRATLLVSTQGCPSVNRGQHKRTMSQQMLTGNTLPMDTYSRDVRGDS